MQIYFVSEASSLTDQQAWAIAWACDYQARFQFGRSGWRSDIRGTFVPKGVQPIIPKGSAIMHFLDTADQPGALGYHDEDGNGVPFGRVFVKTTLDSGGSISEVASHETLELAADPHINDSCLTGDGKFLWAKEVGDPCQGNAYDVGAPEGRTIGIAVADFCLPSFFDPRTRATQPTTFRGSLNGPFQLGSQGYYSYVDMSNTSAGWQQKVGAERTAPPTPDQDDRLGRR